MYDIFRFQDYIHPWSRHFGPIGGEPPSQIVRVTQRLESWTRVGVLSHTSTINTSPMNKVLCMYVNTNLVFKLSKYSVTSMYNAIKYNANQV